MKKKVKEQWVKALRSRKYKQCKLRLKNADGEFCVLGVLCDLYAKENEIDWEMSITGQSYLIEGSSTTLPQKVRSWAGIQRKAVDFEDGQPTDPETQLMYLNDNGTGFREIANVIEEKL